MVILARSWTIIHLLGGSLSALEGSSFALWLSQTLTECCLISTRRWIVVSLWFVLRSHADCLCVGSEVLQMPVVVAWSRVVGNGLLRLDSFDGAVESPRLSPVLGTVSVVGSNRRVSVSDKAVRLSKSQAITI